MVFILNKSNKSLLRNDEKEKINKRGGKTQKEKF